MSPEENHHDFKHYLLLVLSSLFIYLWVNNKVLSAYNLQLTAFLIIFYFAVRFFLSKKGDLQYLLDVIIFNAVLLLVLYATGGLNSPLFFLIYFLFFASALLFEIPFTLILTLTITLFFANSLNSVHSAMQLLSLVFFSPLAIFFGRQYLRLLQSRQTIKILNKEKKKDEKALKNDETDSLLWLSINLKNSLIKIIDKSSDLLADIGRLTPKQKENLQSINQTAKDLLVSGGRLKEIIDKETD